MARRIRCHARLQQLASSNAPGPEASQSSDGVPSLARCRALLGDEGVDLSDEELDRVRRHAAALARVLVFAFLESRSTID
jgi:hypothetical protein